MRVTAHADHGHFDPAIGLRWPVVGDSRYGIQNEVGRNHRPVARRKGANFVWGRSGDRAPCLARLLWRLVHPNVRPGPSLRDRTIKRYV